MDINKVAIIGLGLIGGSYGLALEKKDPSIRVLGYARREETRKLAKEIKAVDEIFDNINESVKEADLVIIATPIDTIPDIFSKIEKDLKNGAIVTDVGSTRTNIVNEIESIKKREDIFFVGSHPMAGSEKSGLEAAAADLFDNALFIITTTENTSLKAASALEEFYSILSQRIITLSPAEHDSLVAFASHLPYYVAVSLVDTLKNLPPQNKEQIKNIISTGFKDTTRVSMSIPVWGKDVAKTNKESILKALENYEERIKWWKEKIKSGSLEEIEKTLKEVKQFRESLYQ